MGGTRSTYGGRGEVYTGLWWGNVRERDHLGRPRHRWEDNIMDLQEVGCGENGLNRSGLG